MKFEDMRFEFVRSVAENEDATYDSSCGERRIDDLKGQPHPNLTREKWANCQVGEIMLHSWWNPELNEYNDSVVEIIYRRIK